jgi:hypothetical protein
MHPIARSFAAISIGCIIGFTLVNAYRQQAVKPLGTKTPTITIIVGGPNPTAHAQNHAGNGRPTEYLAP